MKHFVELDVSNVYDDLWVFFRREPPESGRPIVRPEFKHLVCPKCGAFDPRRALELGVSPDASGPSTRRDAVVSCDHCLVVSARSKESLQAVPGLQAHFFVFPSDPEYFAMYPSQIFRPPSDTRISVGLEPAIEGEPFQVWSRPCRKCGQVREVTFRAEWFSVPDDVVLAGVELRKGKEGASIAWVASPAVAEVIKSQGLTGWIIRHDAFANSKPPKR